MKKTLILILLIVCALFACKKDEPQRCAITDEFNLLIEKNPETTIKQLEIERGIETYLKRFNLNAQNEESVRGGRLIIPVVVHVLYNNNTSDATNVSDARIDEQIERLNLDFRRLNTDASSVPSAFASLVADSRIEFQKAQRDPSCNATTGIVRKLVTATSITPHNAKFNSTGGDDAWDTRKYLNIWVIPRLCIGSSCSYLGSASFPSFPQNEHGFVVAYRYLGNTSDPDFNLGRTATHEFGHYFNLNHIWGDDCGIGNGICSSPTECNGTDNVADTPNQGEMNYGTPAFPLMDCCSSTSPGVMFMNYMDYVNDPAMFMFSQGQTDRMVATLYTTMSGLLSSDALIPPVTGASDLFIQDTPEDIGNEPNNESTIFYASEDIWVRNSNDGTINQEHRTPIYRPSGSPPNYVYVRVRNRGCSPAGSANVKLYWAKASSGLSWPNPWNGGITVGTALMGGEVGTVASGSVAGASSTIVEFPWTPPNPADYSAFGADNAHFCLLAVIEPVSTSPESLHLFVKNSNDRAWKNVQIATTDGRTGARVASTLLANYDREKRNFSIGFSVPQREQSAFTFGEILVELSPKVFENWRKNGSKGIGIQLKDERLIQLKDVSAIIEGISLGFKQQESVKIYFNENLKQKRLGPHVYFLDVSQFSDNPDLGNFVGAQRIWIKSFNQNR